MFVSANSSTMPCLTSRRWPRWRSSMICWRVVTSQVAWLTHGSHLWHSLSKSQLLRWSKWPRYDLWYFGPGPCRITSIRSHIVEIRRSLYISNHPQCTIILSISGMILKSVVQHYYFKRTDFTLTCPQWWIMGVWVIKPRIPVKIYRECTELCK